MTILSEQEKEILNLNAELGSLRTSLAEEDKKARETRADFQIAHQLLEHEISTFKRVAFRDNKVAYEADLKPHYAAYKADMRGIDEAEDKDISEVHAEYESIRKRREADYTQAREALQAKYKKQRLNVLEGAEKSIKVLEAQLEELVLAHAKKMDASELGQAQLKNQIKLLQKQVDKKMRDAASAASVESGASA